MTTYKTSLFLGLPKTETYEQALKKADPKIVSTFLSNDGKYLYEMSYYETKFIGKHVGEITDIQALQLVESNVYSLLKKLFPELPVDKTPLKLIPIFS